MFRIKPVVLFPPASLKKLVNTTHYSPRSQLILQSCRAASTATGNTTFLSQIYSDLSGSSWVVNTQHLLETVHDYTHLPWWATIVVSTISLRLAITLPLAAYQHIIYARLGNLKPEMDAILKDLKKETDRAVIMYKWDAKKAKLAFHVSAKKQWNLLIQRDNCHQFKATVLLWGQIPLWVCMSVALRNMAMMLPVQTIDAQILYLSLSTGGFGWIPNLTEVDHSLILPVFMALTNLAIIQIQVMSKVGPSSRLSNAMMNVLRVFCLVMVPVAAYAPADVALYWTVSSVYGLAQNLVLLSPSFRRFSRIPVTRGERPQPYRHIVNQIKAHRLFQ
ncbi:cytochrome c oxidase assembly protein COX18, mitochondrial-like [Daphnia pulicaria]|uniref:cytochrome c oxidase assembly protein COX18, mitochondrial-like n=1 Tax=Daphnia pulicaria TaxID=35523 RepID=UPI001EEA0C32|nr:cytochrome c oxidase assembly protein COX18, mitochondrial-like [Daphnia pulicaria]